jgi:hypothetical protein
MIPNVNQFTEQLRMMPDQALQRVAMMYKNDPYILPMVIAEDAARKKMRMAAQAQMAQPQTKVADQAIMSMGEQPQAVPGLAALRAPNMEGMADGGIAGYAEGGVSDTAEDAFSRGGMFDFTQRSEPVVRMADGGAVQRFDEGGTTPFGRSMGRLYQSFFGPSEARLRSDLSTTYGSRAGIPGLFMEQTDTDVETATVIDRLLPSLTESQLKALKQHGLLGIKDIIREKAPALYEKLDAEARARAKPPAPQKQPTPAKTALTAASLASMPVPYEDIEAAYGPEAERMPQVQAGQAAAAQRGIPSSGPAAQRAAAPGAVSSAAPGAAAQRPTAPGTAAGAATSAAGTAPTAREFVSALTPQGAMDVAGAFLPTGTYEEALKAQRRREDARRLTAQARREEATPTEPAQAGLEALLKKQAEGAEKEMSQAGAWGLISAGLAVASGESPNALVNIAKGLNIGAKEYQAAVSKLKEAGKQRDLQLANIQEARRLEAKGDTKEALDRMERADEQQTASERYFLSAEQDLGLKKGQLAAGFYTKERESAAADRRQGAEFAFRARMQAADIGSRERLAAADADLRRELAELPGPEQRLYSALGGGSVKDGFIFVQQAKTSEQAMATLAGKILSTPGAMEMLKKSNPDVYDSINAYIQGMGVRSVSAPPAGAPVLP